MSKAFDSGLLAELEFLQSNATPLLADNTNAIQISTNHICHKRTKNIKVDYHSVREALDNGVIFLSNVSSNLQIVDVLTKSMNRQRH